MGPFLSIFPARLPQCRPLFCFQFSTAGHRKQLRREILEV
ncbi:hypothetical protein HMPREF9436_00663 [Faecalibacterium cf. prausnitzii KLE1255]|uniref:Uncharacterized protein n=1 Tax=Faecalibacterium cf. prausnitzii KLE1255 TaxID=748224 RepID=E2ZG78_9FIRM|nr:hypothetical protein HMPREF9436_00663 [Faecalibacterium cf. prausnitzii KLE1255]